MLDPVSGYSKPSNNVYRLAELFDEKYKNSDMTEEEIQNHITSIITNIENRTLTSYSDEGYYSPILKYCADVLNGMRWLCVIYILFYLCILPITIVIGLMISASFSFSLFFMIVLFTVPFMLSIFGVIFIPSDRDDTIDLLMDIFSRLNGEEGNDAK